MGLRDVVIRQTKPSHVHHFLFGYNRGHTLIIGSDKLGSSLEAHLARKSDLVPGAELEDTQSYMSGFPVDEFTYALVMTWAAPEMPRPGCVWSHVILLERSIICEISDLSVFKNMFRQPRDQSDLDFYSKPLKLKNLLNEFHTSSLIRNSNFSSSDSLRVLEAVYAPNSKGFCKDVGKDRENIIFAIWSQQWDDLRMKFTFHTAVFARIPDKKSLDSWITFVRVKQNTEVAKAIPEWLVLLLKGLRPSSQIMLFFNSVGPSLPPERASIRLLARLRAFDLSSNSHGELKALKFLAREVKTPESGIEVKNWLLDIALNSKDVKTTRDLLDFFLKQKGSKSFLSLWAKLQNHLPDLWNEDPLSYYSVFTTPIRADNDVVRSALENLVNDSRSPQLFQHMNLGCWNGRLEIAKIKPKLLIHKAIAKAPEGYIIQALGIVRDDSANYRRIIAMLLNLPLAEVATDLTSSRFEVMSEEIFSAVLGQEHLDYSHVINYVWLSKIRAQPSKFAKRLLSSVRSLSEITVIFSLLDWDSKVFEGITSEDWSGVLKRIDTSVKDKPQWAVVLMILTHALSKGGRGAEPFFEYAVPVVYNALKSGAAPEFVKVYINENAEKYWSIPNLDLCERLKRQVENIYHYEDLQSSNFEALFSAVTPRSSLKSMQTEIKIGQKKIFMSYCQADKHLAKQVVSALIDKGVEVQADTDFAEGLGNTDQVELAILEANCVIILLTNEYLKSQLVAKKLAFLMDQCRLKELKLIALRFGVKDQNINDQSPLLSGILSYYVDENNIKEVLEPLTI